MIDINIDSSIKYWVFIPILMGLIFFSKIKNNLQAIMSEPKKSRIAIKSETGYKDKLKKCLKKFNSNKSEEIPKHLLVDSKRIFQ